MTDMTDRQMDEPLIIQVFPNVLLEQEVVCEWLLGLLAFCVELQRTTGG